MNNRNHTGETIKSISKDKDENAQAREESEMMANDPNARRFTDIDELFKELDN